MQFPSQLRTCYRPDDPLLVQLVSCGLLGGSSEPPHIEGDAYIGSEITSSQSAQWLLNGEPIIGETGETLVVPESALLGDEITQSGSNVLTVIRIPDSIGIRIDTELPGSASNTMVIPARNAGSYAARIYWGDGSWDDVTTYNAAELTHTYPTEGIYDIQISGTFRGFYFNNGGDRQKLLRIDQWGDTGQASSQDRAFYNCTNLTTLPDDMTLANLTNGGYMFQGTPLTTLPDGMTLPNLTNGNYMFRDTSITTLPDDMTLPNLTNGAYMFRDTSITTLPDDMTLPNLDNGSEMFRGTSITTLPDDMTLANLTNGGYMFQGTPLTTLPDGMTLPNLTNGNGMFQNTSLTTLPDGMTLSNLTSGAGMFQNTSITTTRYSQLLIDLSDHNPNDNVSFHGGNSKYNEAGAIARAALIGRGWTITDGGPE